MEKEMVHGQQGCKSKKNTAGDALHLKARVPAPAVFIRKSFKFRAYPNKGTGKRTFKMMKKMAEVWNIALDERNKSFEKSKIDPNIKPINSYKSQYHNIRKREHPEYAKYNAQSLQDVQVKLDSSWKSFFALIKKKDKTARPPKKKGIHKCIVFRQSGWRLEGNKLIIPTLGKFKIRMHRPIEGRIKTVSVTLDKNLWFVNFSCEIKQAAKKRKGKTIKIVMPDDCFLKDSQGNVIASLDFYERTESKIQRLSRIKDRRKKGSRNRKKAVRTLAKCHRHIRNQRDYYLWSIAKDYADKYRRIVLYTRPFKLAMQYAVSTEEAKLTADNARSRFVDMVNYKCNESGAVLTIIKDEKLWKEEIEKRTEVAEIRAMTKLLRKAKKTMKSQSQGRLKYLKKGLEQVETFQI